MKLLAILIILLISLTFSSNSISQSNKTNYNSGMLRNGFNNLLQIEITRIDKQQILQTDYNLTVNEYKNGNYLLSTYNQTIVVLEVEVSQFCILVSSPLNLNVNKTLFFLSNSFNNNTSANIVSSTPTYELPIEVVSISLIAFINLMKRRNK